jgi:sortase A
MLLAAGVALLGYVVYVEVDTWAYQALERRRFEDVRLHALPAPAAIVEGDAIGEIVIARIGLRAMVAQGESAQVLQRAVGHLADTALPGELGNVVLAGHRDTFFRPLRDVQVGDTVLLRTRTADVDYVVESTAVVPPTDLDVLQPAGGRTLTLITCFPFSFVGSAPDRFIVRAREVIGVP